MLKIRIYWAAISLPIAGQAYLEGGEAMPLGQMSVMSARGWSAQL